MLSIRGVLPPSVNNYWKVARTGHRYITPTAKSFKEFLEWKYRSSKKPYFADKDIKLTYILYTTKKGRKDLDNTLKAIQDSLEGVAYDNDRQIVKIDATKKPYSGFDGFDVKVEEYIQTSF